MSEIEQSPLAVVQEQLSQCELLAMLAEEAAELSHAALKLRRAYDQTNPTPVKPKEAYEYLLEEIADVSVCLTAPGYDRSLSRMRVSMTFQEKLERWAGRLAACPGENGGTE